MFPNGDSVREQRGFDFYNKLIDALLEAGIEPNGHAVSLGFAAGAQDKGGGRTAK
jgi:beta-glucosidase